MALNLTPAQGSGMASLAGRGTPNLNLPLWGLQTQGYGQQLLQGANIAGQLQTSQNNLAAQQQMNLFNQIQENARNKATLLNSAQIAQGNQQNQMAIAQMGNTTQQQQIAQQGAYQQGELANQQQQNKLQAQQIAQTGAYQQGQLGVAQQDVGVRQQQLQIEAMKAMMPMQLAKLGASNALMLMGLNQYAGDPQQLASFIQSQNAEDVKDGIISPNEAAARAQMTPQQLQAEALRNVMITGYAAGSHGNMAAANMMPSGAMGNIYGNITAGKTTTDQTETGLAGTQRAMMDLTNSLNNFDPSLFSYSSQIQQDVGGEIGKAPEFIQKATNFMSSVFGTPSTEQMTSQAAAARAFKSNMLQGIMDTLNQQKGVRFNQASVSVLEPEIPTIGAGPEGDSPQEAFSKMVTLYQRMQHATDFEATLLKQGLEPNSEKFQSKVMDYLKTSPVSGKLTYTTQDGQQHPMGYEDVKGFAEHNKQSFGQTVQYILQHG